MKEGDRLQAIYLGPNAEEIGGQLGNLAASWQELKEMTLIRRNKLLASYDLQKFLSKVIFCSKKLFDNLGARFHWLEWPSKHGNAK